MLKTALVTGANGFIGAHLSNTLVKQGYKVFGLYRSAESKNPEFNENVKNGKIEHLQGDITTFDFSKFQRVDEIYHIAGKVSVWGKMDDFLKVNLDGTKNVLAYASRVKPDCFTYFSSTCVYGFYGYFHLPETAEKKPFKNPYSLSKLQTEDYVQQFCKDCGVDYLIVRPANVFGEYDYTSSHEIFSRVKRKKMLMSAGGKYKSCFVYSQNLVDAVLHLTQNKKYHNTDYNISDGRDETLKEYLTMIATGFGVKPKFTNVPAPIAKMTAGIVEGFYKLFRIKKAPLITKFSVYQNCADYNYSIEKLKSTGFEPKVEMQEAINKTCEWINNLQKRS